MGQLKQYRVAIYCRVSTDEQSCDRQERDLVSYAQLSGFEVVAVYKETASGAQSDRSEKKFWRWLRHVRLMPSLSLN
jgi:DNA invertase Pin-like site-specific DNA recombinase